MTSLSLLWLPILASAVLVFVASSIIHMVTPWHKGDYPKVPDEDKLINVLRPLAIPPGDYMVPGCADTKEMRTPAFAEKRNQGPVMVMTVMPSGPISMTGNLVQWFVYSVVVSFFAAYVASRALPVGHAVCPSVPPRRRDCVRRIRARAVANVDLVSSRVGHDDQGDNRRLDLGVVDRRNIWMAMAAMSGSFLSAGPWALSLETRAETERHARHHQYGIRPDARLLTFPFP